MNKSVFYIVFLFSISLNAQENLVPNGSFEEYNNCPDYANGYYITAAKEWFMPTLGSSDYINSCSTETGSWGELLFSVPQNDHGYQNARTGSAYGGYYAGFNPTNNNYYEYLSVKLTKELEKDRFYHLTYYLSLADSSISAANGVPQQFANHSAAYFSKSIQFANNDLRINGIPQVISDPNVFLNDSLGWQKVEGYFLASGEEQYVTIGFFCNFEDLTLNYFTGIDVTIYYYIDDVSLEEVELEFPNVFTPNDDGVNDFFEIKMLPAKSEIYIMNRWGDSVFHSNGSNILSWDGTFNGEICSEGTYFYKIVIGTIEKTGFIQLIR